MSTRTSFILLAALAWLSPTLSAPAKDRVTAVESVQYAGHDAWKLSDGRTEAIVVPALGRVMRYGSSGGENWLWNGDVDPGREGFKNWGGDKLFIGPHSAWATFAKSIWPPRSDWDGPGHEAVAPGDGTLRTTSNVWPGFEVRISRLYRFDDNGDFVIEQTFEKTGGEPRFLSLWNVSQAAPPDAVYLPVKPESAYVGGFHRFGKPRDLPGVEAVPGMPKVLKVVPVPGKSFKIGVDSTVAALIAVRGEKVWRQRADLEKGSYPDGADGAGFPVEFYNHNASGKDYYIELELLSPLWRFEAGDKRSFTIRWSLHDLPANEREAEIARLLGISPE